MPAAPPAMLDPSAPVLLEELHSAKSQANSVHSSPDNAQLVTGCQDGVVVMWHLHPRPRAFRYIGHQAPVSSVRFSPSGSLAVSAAQDRTIRLWVPKVRGGSTVIHAHQGAVRAAQFFPTGDRVVTGADDKVVKTWCVTTQKAVATFAEHTNWVRCVSVAPDGRIGGSGGDDKTAKLWDFAARQPKSVHTLMHHCDSVTDVAFGPDGHSLATCSVDRTLKLFDIRTYRLLQHYDAHSDAIRQLSWHPSGHFLLSCSQDSTIKVWDLRVGYLFYTLSAHAGPVNSVSFSTDGATFHSAGVDHKVLVWRANFDREPAVPLDGGRPSRGAPAKASARPAAVAPQRGTSPPSPSAPPQTVPVPPPPGAASPLDAAPAIPVDGGGEAAADTAACLEYVMQQVDLLSRTLALVEGRTSSAGDLAHDCADHVQRLEQRVAEDRQVAMDTSVELLQTVKQLAGQMENLETSFSDRESAQARQLEALQTQLDALARENVALRRQIADMHLRELRATHEPPQRLTEPPAPRPAPTVPVPAPAPWPPDHDPTVRPSLGQKSPPAEGGQNGPHRSSPVGSVDLHTSATSHPSPLSPAPSHPTAASSVLYSSISSRAASAGPSPAALPAVGSAEVTFGRVFGLSPDHASMLPPSFAALFGGPQPARNPAPLDTSVPASKVAAVPTATAHDGPAGPPAPAWTSPLSPLWTSAAGLSAPDHMFSPEGVQRSLIWSSTRTPAELLAMPPSGEICLPATGGPQPTRRSSATSTGRGTPHADAMAASKEPMLPPASVAASRSPTSRRPPSEPGAAAEDRRDGSFGVPDDMPVEETEEG
eukprot:EG_transcript_2503